MFYNSCQSVVSLPDVGNPRVYFALSHNQLLLDFPFVAMLVHFSSVDCMYDTKLNFSLHSPWRPTYVTAWFQSFLTSALDESQWSASRLGNLSPGEEPPVPIA